MARMTERELWFLGKGPAITIPRALKNASKNKDHKSHVKHTHDWKSEQESILHEEFPHPGRK